MPKVYGREAVEVENPGGEICLYAVRPVAALPLCWRSWEVTKADGTTHAVSELPTGAFVCTCPAFKHDRHGAGRWQKVGGRRTCKHAKSVADWLAEQTEAPTDASIKTTSG